MANSCDDDDVSAVVVGTVQNETCTMELLLVPLLAVSLVVVVVLVVLVVVVVVLLVLRE
jgi:hypothetical protein